MWEIKYMYCRGELLICSQECCIGDSFPLCKKWGDEKYNLVSAKTIRYSIPVFCVRNFVIYNKAIQ